MTRNKQPAPGGHREAGSGHYTRRQYSNVVRFPSRPPPTISELIEAGRRTRRHCAACGGLLIQAPAW